MSEDAEITEGGSRVYRHAERTIPFEPAGGDGDLIDAISEHIERHIGPIESVFHELVSDLVHLDVHWVKPGDDRPYHTLITTGMSEAPMNVPEDGGEPVAPRHAELLIKLPPDWPLSQEAFEDESHYWPIRWLKTIARLPHEYDTWLGVGHTIPNGDPSEPFADNTRFEGMLVFAPVTSPEESWSLHVNDAKQVQFYALFPLYPNEMSFKLKKGVEPLLDRFEKHGVTDVVDINRADTCRKKWGLF